MPNKILIRCLARPAEILTAIVILLLAVFILQMIVLAIEMVLIVPAHQKQANDIQTEPNELTTQEKIGVAKKEFLSDGTMLFIYSDNKQVDGRSKFAIEIFDANSNLVWQGIKFPDSNNKQVWQSFDNTPLPFREFLEWNVGYQDKYYRTTERRFAVKPDFSESLNCIFYSDEKREVWQYSFTGRYFTGCTSAREIIGYIGLNGFVENKADVKPFDRLINWERQNENNQISPVVLWITDHYVCQVDIPNRKVDVILKTETSKITKYCIKDSPETRRRAQAEAATIKYRPAMDFVTEDNIHHLLLRNPEQKLNITMPKENPGKKMSIGFTATENDIFFRITTFEMPESQVHQTFQDYEEYTYDEIHCQINIYKLNQSGTLDILNHYEWTRPERKYKEYFEPVQISKPFVTAFSPPVYDWLWRNYSERIESYHHIDSIPLALIFGVIAESRPLNTPFNLFICIAIMGFTLWHGLARRTCWAKLIFWVILTGLLNLAGLLAYLALNHTPVIKCSNCGKKRGLETDNCSQCGSPLPVPQRKPTDLIMA
jgi:hypothetical protein